MAKVIKTTFQLRRGLSYDWADLNPILASGEPGFEIDTNKLKIGNGVYHYNDLEYINEDIVIICDNLSIITDSYGRLSLFGYTDAVTNTIPSKSNGGFLNWVSIDELPEWGEVNRNTGLLDVLLQNTVNLTPLGTAAYADKAESISDNTKLPTVAQVKDYVQSVIEVIPGFNIVVLDPTEPLPEPSAATTHTLYLKPASSPTTLNYYEEWLTIEKTTAQSTQYVWELIGSTQIDLTNYLDINSSVAGVAFGSDKTITATELKTALALGALAYKDNATGSITIPVSANPITVAAAGLYSVEGTIVNVPSTFNGLDVTPSGSVTLTATQAASVQYNETKSVGVSVSQPQGAEVPDYVPSGSITLPTISNSVSGNAVNVATITDSGTDYTLTGGSVVKGNDTTQRFAIRCLTATIDDIEEELIFEYANPNNTNYFDNGISSIGDITYTSPTLSGALPTFGSETVLNSSNIQVTSTYDAPAQFAGNGVLFDTTITNDPVTATVTQPQFTAEFVGDEQIVTPTIASTQQALGSSATVLIGTENKNIVLNTETQTITVS